MPASYWSSFRQAAQEMLPKDYLCILNNRHFLAINKPPFISIESNNTNFPSIEQFTPEFSRIYGCDLKLVNRSGIGNSMSGIILFCKTQESYDYMLKLYAEKKITEKYLVILTSTPPIESGNIKVPIRLVRDGCDQVFCVPECSLVYKDPKFVSDSVLPAVSSFKVLSAMRPPPHTFSNTYKNYYSRARASLVVIETSTCYKDQVRAHCSEILGCDILGDHKYSKNSNKPQTLSKFMGKLLKLKSEWDVKNLPLFLHLSEMSFSLPTPSNKHIYIRSSLPDHFKTGLELLQIPDVSF